MKKNPVISVVIFLTAVVLLTGGCGKSTNETGSSSAYSYEPVETAGEAALYSDYSADSNVSEYTKSGTDDSSQLTQGTQSERKLIKNVNLDAETEDLSGLEDSITKKTEELGGYIESSQINGSENTYTSDSYYSRYTGRNAWLTVRIPAENLDSFVETVEGISNITSQSVSVEDVTLQYVDLESHKNALEAEEKRLLELLDEADNVADMIAIESELTNVRYQLESMESQLRVYDNQVDYSTVTINITEVREYTPKTEELTAGERIMNGLAQSMSGLGNGLCELGIWLIIHIPYIIFLAVVIFLIVFIIRKIAGRRQRRSKKQRDQAEKEQVKTEQVKTEQDKKEN